MLKQTVVLLGVIFSVGVCYAQQHHTLTSTINVSDTAHRSGIYTVQCLGFINPESDDINLMPNLWHKASENDGENLEEILKIKDEAEKLRYTANKTDATEQTLSTSVPKPVIGKNFVGNSDPYGCPQDNTIAISKGGKVVCMVNSLINYYDITTSTYSAYTFSRSLMSFYHGLGVNNNLCDPKVLYDPIKDRFIMYTQTCEPNDTISHILISFSKSNDPKSGWYIYKISGNSNTVDKTGTNTWSDYPQMGISTNEVFITANQFSGVSPYPFQGASIYELDKTAGYSGSSMKMKYWSSVSGASNAIPNSPFTLMPVSEGHGSSFGPGIWLLASISAPSGFYGSKVLHSYRITDDMTSKTQAINAYDVTLSNGYFLGSNIPQKGYTGTYSKLDNGDCRMQSGFYLNGIIHCVFTSANGSSVNCINYSRIDVSSGKPGTVTNKLIADASSADISYPAVASLSSSYNNQTALLAFVRASSSLYPEFDVARVDDSMNVSSFVTVKAGNIYDSLCYDANHKAVRWGDYSGIAYRPGQKGTDVWVTGTYGDGNSASTYWSTYIAEIQRNDVGVDEVINSPLSNQKIAPNPVVDRFVYSFNLNTNTEINITLLDVSGRLVSIMYKGTALKGDNVFTFNRATLSNGIYFLRISDGINILGFEKIIISH